MHRCHCGRAQTTEFASEDDYCRGYCINLIPSSRQGVVSSPISWGEGVINEAVQPGAGYRDEMGPLLPPSPEHMPTLPALPWSRDAQEALEELHANSKLSDLERVRALPRQEKPEKP